MADIDNNFLNVDWTTAVQNVASVKEQCRSDTRNYTKSMIFWYVDAGQVNVIKSNIYIYVSDTGV